MKIPTCKVCGNDHYNFKPCPPREDLKPQVMWSDNSNAWGNKLIDLKWLGGNNFVQRREYDK